MKNKGRLLKTVTGTGVALLLAFSLIFASGPITDRASASDNALDLGRVLSGAVSVTALATVDDSILVATGYGAGSSAGGRLVLYRNGTFADKGIAVPGADLIRVLATASDGNVYGGTNNYAYLFYYSPADGQSHLIGQALPNARDLWALTATDDGTLYGGVEPGAVLFSFKPAVDRLPVARGSIAGESRITALAKGSDGKVYGTTSPHGVIFSYDPTSNVLATSHTLGVDTSAIVLGQGGITYVAGKNNHIYAISGGVADLGEPVPGETRVSSLIAGADGAVYGGTYPGGRLFSYRPSSGFVNLGRTVDEESDVTALTLANGIIYGGTGSVGHLFNLDPARAIPTDTPTPTPSSTHTATPTPTYTPTPTDTPSATPTDTATVTPIPADTTTPTPTPTPSSPNSCSRCHQPTSNWFAWLRLQIPREWS